MDSPDEQEEFLRHGRFGEGQEVPARIRGARVRPAGLLLIIAAMLVFFSPRFRLVEEILAIAVLLGIGSAVSTFLAICERTGLGVLISAGMLLIIALGSILLSPAMKPSGFGLAGGAIGFFVFVGCLVSAILGGVVIIVGVVVDRE